MNGNITVDFTVGDTAISIDQSLVITYPPEYGNLRAFSLACTLSPVIAVANFEVVQFPNCSITARSIVVTFAKELNQTIDYTLQVGGIIGPEFSTCQSKKPTFGIIDETSTFIYMTSENAVNMASPAYEESKDIIYIAYY